MQQKTFNFFYAFLLAVLGLGVTLMAEDITLTTYYPAPYGVYDELTTTGNTNLAITSGNVGIGTTNPDGFQANIAVSEGARDVNNIRLGVCGGTPRIIFESSASSTIHEIDNFAGKMRFFRPGVVSMVIDENGRVGIGRDPAIATLEIEGTIAMNGIPGVSGVFYDRDGKAIIVTNGIITDITP